METNPSNGFVCVRRFLKKDHKQTQNDNSEEAATTTEKPNRITMSSLPSVHADSSVTPQESKQAWTRMVQDAADLLAVGPLYAIAGGTTAVAAIGMMEGAALYKAPFSGDKALFVIRYGLSQMLPSIVRFTQPAWAIAQNMGIPADRLHGPNDPQTAVRVMRLMALRSLIAGSVVLSQVIALTSVLGSAKENFGRSIQAGKEPPLDDPTQCGVVIRLAGEQSDATTWTMLREGRRRIFPIFEDASNPHVQSLVQKYACGRNDKAATNGTAVASSSSSSSSSADSRWSFLWVLLQGSGGKNSSNKTPRVPVYWQVDDGRYSYDSSWDGMRIPKQWLFDVKNGMNKETTTFISPEKLLILEADASSNGSGMWSFRRHTESNKDLDLYEIAQGFHRLSRLVSDIPNKDDAPKKERGSRPYVETLRVLLVDTSTLVETGGSDRTTTVREHIREFGLADIVIDSTKPLLCSLTMWLDGFDKDGAPNEATNDQDKTERPFWARMMMMTTKQRKPVVLETPVKAWFESLRMTLAPFGYTVMDRHEAIKRYGSLRGIPFLVYHHQTADTLHTVRQFLARSDGPVPSQVCALCPQPILPGMEQIDGVHCLSSAAIYDKLLRFTRDCATGGKTQEEIQQKLDENLEEVLKYSTWIQ